MKLVNQDPSCNSHICVYLFQIPLLRVSGDAITEQGVNIGSPSEGDNVCMLVSIP